MTTAAPLPTPPARLRLRNPVDVVRAVPYLVGFHPDRSLVVMALRGERRRVGFTLRVDLPAGNRAGELAQLVEPLRRESVRQVLAIVYPPPPGVVGDLPAADVVAALRTKLARHGITLMDALCVAGDRVRSYFCDNTQCCPADGVALPTGLDDSVVAATLAYEGQAPMASRQALVDSLRPPQFLARVRMMQALQSAGAAAVWPDPPALLRWRGETVRRLREVLVGWLDRSGELSDDEAAELIVAVHDIAVRDELVELAYGPAVDAAVHLWTELTRRAIPPYDVAPATLLAHAAYLSGRGALAHVALDRALATDPDYRLALLLRQALQCGLNPRRLRSGRRRAGAARRRHVDHG